MKNALLILTLLIVYDSYSQDSSTQKLKYTLTLGFGAGSGKYVKGGFAETAALGVAFMQNEIRLSFFSYSEFQLFGKEDPPFINEFSLLYHRNFSIGKFEPSIGAGISLNKYKIDLEEIYGRPGYSIVPRYLYTTNIGVPLCVSINYKIKRWKLQGQYHYNINPSNFQGATLNFWFAL